MEKVFTENSDGVYTSYYRLEGRHNLSEIVQELSDKGLQFVGVKIEETVEHDMQDFGSKYISISDENELEGYYNSDSYMIMINANLKGETMEIRISGNLFATASKNPDLEFSNVFEDIKKNEIDDMLNNDFDNKEMVDNSNYKLK